MTAALLFAITPVHDAPCSALLDVHGEPIVHRMARQLAAQGCDRIEIVTFPEWHDAIVHAVADLDVVVNATAPERLATATDAFARTVDEQVVIGHADIVCHDGVLTGLLRDPRVHSGILTTRGRVPGKPWRTWMRQGRVISAESPFHAISEATTKFLSLMVVHADDLHHLRDATAAVCAATVDGRPPVWDAELGRKVEVWGRAYTSAQAARYHLAEQLDRLGDGPEWQPRAAPLRDELDKGFADTVLRRAASSEHDIVAITLTALTRTPIELRSAYLRNLYWHRPMATAGTAVAQEQLDSIDEDKMLLDSAVKSDDGFFTTFFVSPYSKYIARWSANRGLNPNQITTFSLLLAVLAAVAFSRGETTWNIVGAVLLQVSFTFDCVDGQLARYSFQFSTLGAWLDSVFDRTKEAVVFVGLAFGALAMGDDVWKLAVAALAFQAVRHLLDFSWAALQHVEIAAVELAPISEPPDTAAAPVARVWPPPELDQDEIDEGDDLRHDVDSEDVIAAVRANGDAEVTGLRRARRVLLRRAIRTAQRAVRAVNRSEQSRVVHWLKKIIVLPIGERLAVISVTAAVGGPELTFTVLIIWGAVATLYMLAGRTLRSL